MPKRCAIYGCRGNYAGQPYTRVVRFPTEEAERERWIKAMPNSGSSLTGRPDLYICSSHFECEWVVSRRGRRPVAPPSVFPGIAKSCLKQSQPKKTRDFTDFQRCPAAAGDESPNAGQQHEGLYIFP